VIVLACSQYGTLAGIVKTRRFLAGSILQLNLPTTPSPLVPFAPEYRKGGQDKKLVGYFQADTGTINQLVHLWKFDDDADRRAHWTAMYANKDFVEGFASKFRLLLMTQEVKLLQPAPWGPHP
jgi:NIPSNAP protein